MFSHIMIGGNDIARSKRFYDALFSAIGGKPGTQDPKGRLVYTHRGGRFMVTKPIDGQPATHANDGTIAFTVANYAEADAWHKAGVSTRMRSFVPFLVAAAVIAPIGPAPARAEITVTRAEYGAGVVTIVGETSRPRQRVTLNGRYRTRTDGNRRFRFRVAYLPRNCTATLRAGRDVRPVVIANCRPATVPGVGPPRRQTAPTAPGR